MTNAIALFDTDKTLLDITTLVEKAFNDALFEHVRRRFKFTTLPRDKYVGVSMMKIYLSCLESLFGTGAEHYGPHTWADVNASYERNLVDMLETQKNTRKYLCPGVIGFLEALKAEGIPRGVYSGAPSGVHQAALQATGLESYFDVRASGEYAKTRAGLIKNCHDQLRRRGVQVGKQRVVVFGDAPTDAEAANEYGAVSVTVSGKSMFTHDEIKKSSPKFVYGSFEDHQRIMRDLFRVE
ncbi:HAD family hydrolase [Candidatus Woesearchaeota archaeon]|nr:HAD family hydrolase [Candidatus Woesearchaeota archaeon]